MEGGADTQSGETVVSESEAQQITLAQVNFSITLNVHIHTYVLHHYSISYVAYKC